MRPASPDSTVDHVFATPDDALRLADAGVPFGKLACSLVGTRHETRKNTDVDFNRTKPQLLYVGYLGDADNVRSKIEEMAAPYDDPEQVINYYYSNQQMLQQVEGIVLEDQVVESLLSEMKVTEQDSTYDEVIAKAQQQDDEEEGESED